MATSTVPAALLDLIMGNKTASDAVEAVGSDLGGLLKPSGFSPYPGMDQDAKSAAAAESHQQDQDRKAAGYSPLYRAAAPVAQAVGVNVPGMEDAAKKGSVGGVLGHAAAPLAMLGAGEVLGHALPGEHPQIASEALQEHVKTGGSTFDPRTGQNLAGSRHYAVGVSPETAQAHATAPTPEQYNSFVAEHRDILARHPNTAVGTQYDPATGLHRMEVVGTTTSKPAAQQMAAHLGEDHAYHLATDNKVPTGANGDWQPSPMSAQERLQQLNSATPPKETYSGTHFSDAKLDMIDGSRRGATGEKGTNTGAEAARLRLGTKTGLGQDAPGGFYTYTADALPDSTVSSRKTAYRVRGQMAFGTTDSPEFQTGYANGVQKALESGADQQTAHQLGLNAAEHALKDAGYDGYYSPKHPNTRFHFGNAEATPVASKVTPSLDMSSINDPALSDANAKQRGRTAEVQKKYPTKPVQPVQDPFAMPSVSGGSGAVVPNGSGESSASMEAIHRAASERAGGVQRFRIDTRSGQAFPLIGVDAVDVAPSPYDVIIQRTPLGDIELARGRSARRTK